jgi:molybdopterin molybdotransferase
MAETPAGAPPEDQGLLPIEWLVERILDTVRELPPMPQPLMDTLGLACAEDVHSPIDLPRFDNSAMDGYAVVHADVADASEDGPVTLPVIGEIGAGQANLFAMSPGSAVKIMTGAPVPAGCDAVVPYEWTDRGVARVEITRAPKLGGSIRRAGEDVREGDLLISRDTVLGPRHLGLLANVGRATVLTRPRPRVVVISTGSELRDAGTELSRDAIYDGNSYLIAAAARAAGAIAYRVGIVPDEPRAFLDALSDQLVRADLVVTSGGVSQGDFDVVKEALKPLGTVWFGRIAMQPGKPQGFGVVGEDETPIFTLPGNPVSSYISFETFVLPALRKMMGKQPYQRPPATMRLTRGITSPVARRQFVRATYDVRSVTPVGGYGSHLAGDLAQANALVVVPEDVTSVAAGEQVEVLKLDEDF